ncbi:hypothetical protein [Actinacidiphila sp. bgisy160]|uniref:hypothetical protein n=1 Tax=Actinacidiphila sp. bgisy160 TaxID=3413796 RepID=UPI003D7349BF
MTPTPRLTKAQARTIRYGARYVRTTKPTLAVLERLGLLDVFGDYTTAGLIAQAELRGDEAGAAHWRAVAAKQEADAKAKAEHEEEQRKAHAEWEAEKAVMAAEAAEAAAEEQYRLAALYFSETCHAANYAVDAYQTNSLETEQETGEGFTEASVWGQIGDSLDHYGPGGMANDTEERYPVEALRAAYDHLNAAAEAGTLDGHRMAEAVAEARQVLTDTTAKLWAAEELAFIAEAIEEYGSTIEAAFAEARDYFRDGDRELTLTVEQYEAQAAAKAAAEQQFTLALWVFGQTCMAASSACDVAQQEAHPLDAETKLRPDSETWRQVGKVLHCYGPETTTSYGEAYSVDALRAAYDHVDAAAEAGTLDADRDQEQRAEARQVLTTAAVAELLEAGDAPAAAALILKANSRTDSGELDANYNPELSTATGFLIGQRSDGRVVISHLVKGQYLTPDRGPWRAQLSAYAADMRAAGWTVMHDRVSRVVFVLPPAPTEEEQPAEPVPAGWLPTPLTEWERELVEYAERYPALTAV